MRFRSARAGSLQAVVGCGLLAAGALLFPRATYAQESPFTFLHKFYSGPRIPSGRLVETADGSLFGTTVCGGEPDASCEGGTIFALRPRADGTWAYEDVHHLRPGLEGSNPSSGLTLARDGSLYGIAAKGGLPRSQAWGTVFRVSPSGSMAPVYAFTSRDSLFNPEGPVGRLVEATDGNLYGSTCLSGGVGPVSRIFQVTPSGGFSTVYRFPLSTTEPVQAPNGMCPLTQFYEGADGFLYGTTAAGGPAVSPFFPPQGTLFRIDPRAASPSASVLHTFRGFDGAVPTGGLAVGVTGEFFGTTAAGGFFGQGTLFRRDPSGAVRTLHAFRGSDGATPFAGVFRATDGTLYGTTLRGGTGHGTVFRAGTSGVTWVHAFTGGDGSVPVEVMRAREGGVYGVTAMGGPGGGGTVYRVGIDGAVATVHAFTAEPRSPTSGVIQGSDGNFYGTTDGGGRRGGGTVYKLTPSGQLTLLHEFEPLSESLAFSQPLGVLGLIQAADGFLYGRTVLGGAHGWGMIYRISTAGALTVLHAFTHYAGDGGLIQGSDGNFYGVTEGDSGAEPTIFRMDAEGRVTTLYTFGIRGSSSLQGPLAEGADGSLYGVAFGPGPFNVGGLYKLTKSGVFEMVHAFAESSSTLGYRPVRGLIRAADGGFYGVTTFSVFGGGPAIYHLDPVTNAVSVVATLPMSNDATVLESRDGVLYGWVAVPEFPRDRYTFFRYDGGGIEYFYDAVESDGRRPSQLIQGTDGALYGTMSEGPSRPWEPESWPADAFAGGVFRLAIAPRK